MTIQDLFASHQVSFRLKNTLRNLYKKNLNKNILEIDVLVLSNTPNVGKTTVNEFISLREKVLLEQTKTNKQTKSHNTLLVDVAKIVLKDTLHLDITPIEKASIAFDVAEAFVYECRQRVKVIEYLEVN